MIYQQDVIEEMEAEITKLINTEVDIYKERSVGSWGILPKVVKNFIVESGLIDLGVHDTNEWDWEVWEYFVSQDGRYIYTISTGGDSGNLILSKALFHTEDHLYIIEEIQGCYVKEDEARGILASFIAKELE